MMADGMIDINAKAVLDDGSPMEVLNQFIEARMKYLHQTLKQSLYACAQQITKSLRALTKTAKP